MWSEAVTSVAPGAMPVSVANAKIFASVDHSDHDALIETFIKSATARAEATTGTRIVPQSIILQADNWNDLEQLPVGPVTSVASIAIEDTAGDTINVAPEDFELFGAGLSIGIRPVAGGKWPTGKRSAKGVITVTAVVGYAELPGTLEAAIMLMVGDLYANRETAATGGSSQIPMSMQVEQLLSLHRIWL